MKIVHMLSVCVSLIAVLSGCAQTAAQSSKPAVIATAAVPLLLTDLSELTALEGRLQIGQPVSLNGTYEGWTGCVGSFAKTRSDWVLKQGDRCIYVTGGLPLGIIPPPSKASNGMPIQIKGKLIKSGDSSLRWLVQYAP